METADSASHNMKLLETNHQLWTQMLDSWTPFSGLCQILLHGVVLLKDCGRPGYSDSGLHSCLFSSLQILCGSSGETTLLSSQTSGTPGVLKPLLVLLEDETSISMKVLSRRKLEGLQHLLVESALNFDLMKHGGSITAWKPPTGTPAAGTPGEPPSSRSLSRSCFPAASTTFSTTSVPFISPWRFIEKQPLWSDL